MGTLFKTTSQWTLLTGGETYVRPTVETYIRFKRMSDDVDYYVLNDETSTTETSTYLIHIPLL